MMASTARKRGDTYILNGTKHWITGGGLSKLHLIFARVIDEAGRDLGIGGFLLWKKVDDGTLRTAAERLQFSMTSGPSQWMAPLAP